MLLQNYLLIKKLTIFLVHLIYLVLILISGIDCQAQEYTLLNHFTTNNGLPSNHIYDILQDNQGFLWFATDNGISRFDGKYFQNYTTADGLSSNEVIQIAQTSDGVIWTNCFKNAPCYYDPIESIFRKVHIDDSIIQLNSTSTFIKTVDKNVITFSYVNGYYSLYKNKRLFYNINKSNTSIVFNNHTLKFDSIPGKYRYFALYKRNKFVKNIPFNLSRYNYYLYKNKLLSFNHDSPQISILQINKNSPNQLEYKEIDTRQEITSFKCSNDKLNVVYSNGIIESFDLASFEKITTLERIKNAAVSYTDNYGNIWIGTIDKGVLLYNKGEIRKPNLPRNFKNENCICIAANRNKVMVGGLNGNVLELNNNQQTEYQFEENENSISWMRKLMYTNNHNLFINENFISIDSENRIKTGAVKTAIQFSNNLIITGSIQGLGILDINKKSYKIIHENYTDDRIYSIAKKNENEIYFINREGLMQYDIHKGIIKKINNKNLENQEQQLLVSSHDSNYVWVSTNKGNLLLLQQNKQVLKITQANGLPQNITNILSLPNAVWISSKEGIYIIRYQPKNSHINYTIDIVTVFDGLPSNTINEMVKFEDSIYVATEKGIAIIPANYASQHREIIPRLVEVTINQQKQKLSNYYNLKQHEKNILLKFSGVDITGHFNHFKYNLDNSSKWTNIEGHSLNVQLPNGRHEISIVCVDNNNNVSKHQLKLVFNIATPFYKTIYFWILISLALATLSFFFYSRRKLRLQHEKFQLQLYQQSLLEKQRQKLTADLHDDIGASLSSLQLNSHVAKELIVKKNFDRAEKLLTNIEHQAKELSNNISDIIWSMKNEKEAFGSFSDRVKTFTNQILHESNIKYTLIIDENIDKYVTEIQIKKNLILIVKEAINNAVKHSQASSLEIKASIKEELIHIIIQDNGIGFDVHNSNGNGMLNIKKRTEELNGTYTLETKIGIGTKFTITIPTKFRGPNSSD